MKTAIMQPYFLPYIGYFQLIKAVDLFVVFDDVNYIKKGWINRNAILINGNSFLFTIPLKNVSQNKQINQILIDDDESWKKNLMKTIEQSYKKAPFFSDVIPLVKQIVFYAENNLAQFIYFSILKICDYLHMNTKIILSSSIEKNNELKGQDKIIEICKILGAKNYINAIGGVELYDKERFLTSSIELNFINTNPITYKQFNNNFVSWLSIVDVLMFNSVEETNKLIEQYKFI
jgi:hypothetical protein